MGLRSSRQLLTSLSTTQTTSTRSIIKVFALRLYLRCFGSAHHWISDHDAFADALEEAERRSDVYLTGTFRAAANPPLKCSSRFCVLVWQAHGRFFNAGANVVARSKPEEQRPTKSARRKETAKIITITDVARQVRFRAFDMQLIRYLGVR